MPCRTASLCRQATTNSSQYLWITDDVLADAWNRFARVSIANRTRSDGRRYGSNVPGPLEARRRSAKRRMGIAATAASSGPPPGLDFGALFGWRGQHHDFKVGEFNYQPPAAHSQLVTQKSRDLRWLFGTAEKKEEGLWSQFLEIPEELEDPVEASRTAFNELLAAAEKKQELDVRDLQGVLSFLRSSRDEPAADNVLTLEKWISTQTLSDVALSTICDLVIEKTRLRVIEVDKAAAIVVAWLANSRRPAEHTTRFLDALSPEDGRLLSLCKVMTEHICRYFATGEPVTSRVKLWLRCLRDCCHLQDFHHNNPIWQSVYDVLAEHFPRPSSLADHFVSLCGARRRIDLSRVLLNHWVPHLLAANDADAMPQVATIGSTKRQLSWNRQHANIGDLKRYFDHVRSTRRPNKGVDRRQYLRQMSSSITDLFHTLARHGVPTAELSLEIFSILAVSQSQSPASAYALFQQMRLNEVPIHDDLANFFIDYFQEHERLDYALSVFKKSPTLSSVGCADLVIALAHDGATAEDIFTMLLRQVADDKIPLSMRSRRKLTLTDDHISLVHLVACSFAASPKVTSAVAFRRVWQCFLFLQDRGATVTSAMTRALVTAGIIRPVKELKRPSVERVRYILSLVGRVEGKSVASGLDRILHEVWQNDVFPKKKAAERAQRLADYWGLDSPKTIDSNPAIPSVWHFQLLRNKQRPGNLVKAANPRFIERQPLSTVELFKAPSDIDHRLQAYEIRDTPHVASDDVSMGEDFHGSANPDWHCLEPLANEAVDDLAEQDNDLAYAEDSYQAVVEAAMQRQNSDSDREDTHTALMQEPDVPKESKSEQPDLAHQRMVKAPSACPDEVAYMPPFVPMVSDEPVAPNEPVPKSDTSSAPNVHDKSTNTASSEEMHASVRSMNRSHTVNETEGMGDLHILTKAEPGKSCEKGNFDDPVSSRQGNAPASPSYRIEHLSCLEERKIEDTELGEAQSAVGNAVQDVVSSKAANREKRRQWWLTKRKERKVEKRKASAARKVKETIVPKSAKHAEYRSRALEIREYRRRSRELEATPAPETLAVEQTAMVSNTPPTEQEEHQHNEECNPPAYRAIIIRGKRYPDIHLPVQDGHVVVKSPVKTPEEDFSTVNEYAEHHLQTSEESKPSIVVEVATEEKKSRVFNPAKDLLDIFERY